jgi:hypothetical protein
MTNDRPDLPSEGAPAIDKTILVNISDQNITEEIEEVMETKYKNLNKKIQMLKEKQTEADRKLN